MTQFLPPNLLALFAPRDPIPFLPPTDKLKRKKAVQPYSGVSQYLNLFEDPSETPPPTFGETREEKEERKRRERLERVERDVEEKMAEWDPNSDPNASSDPFKTLFVARINYDTSESKLRRELESYGPVRRIKMVVNTKTGKSRGYAFVEFESERDMHAAYKHADGKKIDGRRILVDVERGRTVKSWRPRRLGGGLGGTRRGGPDVNIRHSGRVDNFDAGRERERERERDRERERPRERRRSRSRERERERERPRERERDNRRDRERERDRDRERDRERDRDRDRRRDRDRERPDRDRDREKDKREKDRDRDRDRDRRRDRDRDRGDKDKDRERERGERDRDRDRERDRSEHDEEDRDERESRDNDRRHYDSASYEEDGQIDVKQELEDGEENPYESKSDYGYDRGYSDPSEELRTKVKSERNYAQYEEDSYNGEADADME